MTPHYRTRESPFCVMRDGTSAYLFYLSCSPDWAHVYKDRQSGVELLTSFWWADAVEFA